MNRYTIYFVFWQAIFWIGAGILLSAQVSYTAGLQVALIGMLLSCLVWSSVGLLIAMIRLALHRHRHDRRRVS